MCPGVFSSIILAEGAGFEPANLSVNGFQDRRHRPLGHPSESLIIKIPASCRGNFLHSFHVGAQYIRNNDASIRLLVIFQYGNKRSSSC